MNYFENMEITNGYRKQTVNTNIIMNHPVLYVFIGEPKKNIQTIKKFYDEKIQDTRSVAYISVSNCQITNFEHSDKENDEFFYKKDDITDFKNKLTITLNKVQNKFLELKYNNPINRRVYIILDTIEQRNQCMMDIVVFIKTFFEGMNNSPLIDIYAITDEKYVDNPIICKLIGNTYKELEQIAVKNMCNMVYIISNFDSNMIISDFSCQYESIALCSILKDCCSSYTQSLNVYNEKNFIDNSFNETLNGYFYSIGIKKIDKPQNVLKMIILKQLISEDNEIYKYDLSELVKKFYFIRKMLFEEIDIIFENTSKKHIENTHSLTLNINKQNENFLTRGEALDALFGVDETNNSYAHLFYEKNIESELENIIEVQKKEIIKMFKQSVLECFESESEGFYITKQLLINLKNNMFEDLAKELENKNVENENIIKVWRNEPYAMANKRTLGMFGKIYKFPFSLIKSYIAIKNEHLKNYKTLQIFNELKNELNMFIYDINMICDKVNYSINYFDSFIKNNLYDKPTIITENFINYYSEQSIQYIKNNYRDFFESVYKDFYKLGSLDINDLFKKCDNYSVKILNTSEFSEKIYTEIYDRILQNENTQFNSTEKITELLYKEINKETKYFLNILFPENLFQTTCFITGDTDLINKFNNDNIGLSVFFDDTNYGLDIIYFIGAFSLSQLFYAEKYGLRTK